MPKREPIIVSYSELENWRQCPMKWQLSYAERWTAPAKPGSALAVGSRWHLINENHYRTIQAAQQAMRLAGLAPEIGTGLSGARWDYTKLDGDPYWDPDGVGGVRGVLARCWDAVLPYLLDGPEDENGNRVQLEEGDGKLCEWMYRGYVAQYGLDPQWTILAVEHGPVVPLPDPRGRPSPFYHLKLKIDLAVQDVRSGQTWLIDHKSGSRRPGDKQLAIDDQFGLYTWAMRQLGQPVHGSIFNYTHKVQTKRVQTLDERYERKHLDRNDKELDALAHDAYENARAAYQAYHGLRGGGALLHSSPNPSECGYRCDFLQAHIYARKGVDLRQFLVDTGMSIEKVRH